MTFIKMIKSKVTARRINYCIFVSECTKTHLCAYWIAKNFRGYTLDPQGKGKGRNGGRWRGREGKGRKEDGMYRKGKEETKRGIGGGRAFRYL